MYKLAKINKESYIENIKAIGQEIIDKSEDILQDYNDSIKELEIKAYIRPGEISDIEINKKYNVIFKKEDNKNE